jgi:hypothetical protein
VVRYENECGACIGDTSDQHGGPQRFVPAQWGRDHGHGGIQQRRFVPRFAACHGSDMVADIELRVVDPDRAATAEWRTDQALTEPRNSGNPLGDQPADARKVESGRVVDDEDHAELLRDFPGIHGQECPVSWAGAHDLVVRRQPLHRHHPISQVDQPPPGSSASDR